MEKLDISVKPYTQNNLTNCLVVLPTSRAKREFAKKFSGTLHKTLTIKEFEERVIYLDDGVFVDDTLRLLLLRKASYFIDYEKLGIDRNFLIFLEHAPFFLKFYDELFNERVSLDDLLVGDIYAEYDNHIAVLKKLLENYKKILIEHGYVDRIVLTENYKVNTEFIKDFDRITIILEGMLNRFELDLINKISNIVTVIIEVEINEYDEKIKNIFFDFNLEFGYKYLLNYSNKTTIEKRELPTINSAKIYKTKNRTMQIAGIKEVIYGLIKDGFDPSKIAVILPDENFSSILKSYDYNNNFNLSMGLPFKNGKFYLELLALYNVITRGEKKDQLFFKRVAQCRADLIDFRDIFLDNKLLNSSEKIAIFYNLNSHASNYEKDIIDKVFNKIKMIITNENLSLIEILYIYINKLKTATIDDRKGGKITVMGALESRYIEFDAVIAVDFNDEFIPVSNIKDQFINTFVRRVASLPTRHDRENLQRSLYYKLFSRSKTNIIFCVDSETSKPSRFLKEIYRNTEIKDFNINEQYLFGNNVYNKLNDQEVIVDIDLSKISLSASKINCYFRCKREFYYRYIKGYKVSCELQNESISVDVGNILHRALKSAIKMEFNTKNQLIDNIIAIAKNNELSARERYEIDLWKIKLDKFAENELKRKSHGAKPIYLEEEFKTVYNGINLEGKVDRVDKLTDGSIEILDYKSGSIPNLKKFDNFQLVIYKILLNEKYKYSINAGFYDLNNGVIYYQNDLYNEIDLFNKILEDYREKYQVFKKTEKFDSCRFCEYSSLCKRVI